MFEISCTAVFDPPVGLDVAITTGVTCYSTDPDVVSPGVASMPGVAAVSVAAGFALNEPEICVASTTTYWSRLGYLDTVTAGPVCKGLLEWGPITDLLDPL